MFLFWRTFSFDGEGYCLSPSFFGSIGPEVAMLLVKLVFVCLLNCVRTLCTVLGGILTLYCALTLQVGQQKGIWPVSLPVLQPSPNSVLFRPMGCSLN